jgi:hydrogenase maturation protease
MNENNANRILVLALGNEIMGDDAAGLFAARELKKEFDHEIDIFEVSSAGFSLIDILEGYNKALILDSIPASEGSCCTFRELNKDDLSMKFSLSPHYVGLPELLELAARLEINFPEEIKALVIEIGESGVIREGLSCNIREVLPFYIEKASEIINQWLGKNISLGMTSEFEETI